MDNLSKYLVDRLQHNISTQDLSMFLLYIETLIGLIQRDKPN